MYMYASDWRARSHPLFNLAYSRLYIDADYRFCLRWADRLCLFLVNSLIIELIAVQTKSRPTACSASTRVHDLHPHISSWAPRICLFNFSDDPTTILSSRQISLLHVFRIIADYSWILYSCLFWPRSRCEVIIIIILI